MGKLLQKTAELYKISGLVTHNENPNPEFHNQYSIQSINLISFEMTSTWGPTGEPNKVSSSAGPLEVEAKDGSCCQSTGNKATAEANYEFKSISLDEISLTITGHVEQHSFENSVSLTLLDLDESKVIGNKEWTVEEAGQLDLNENLTYNISIGSNYRLTLIAMVNCGDTTGARSHLKAVINSM